MASEQITCQFKTISEVIRENGVERIDLLKIDVEKSEQDVLSGIREEDWKKIRQCVVEVHDTDGRLEWVTSLFGAWYEVTVEQDALLKNTGLYNVYALMVAESDSPPSEASGREKEASQSVMAQLGGVDPRCTTLYGIEAAGLYGARGDRGVGSSAADGEREGGRKALPSRRRERNGMRLTGPAD